MGKFVYFINKINIPSDKIASIDDYFNFGIQTDIALKNFAIVESDDLNRKVKALAQHADDYVFVACIPEEFLDVRSVDGDSFTSPKPFLTTEGVELYSQGYVEQASKKYVEEPHLTGNLIKFCYNQQYACIENRNYNLAYDPSGHLYSREQFNSYKAIHAFDLVERLLERDSQSAVMRCEEDARVGRFNHMPMTYSYLYDNLKPSKPSTIGRLLHVKNRRKCNTPASEMGESVCASVGMKDSEMGE